MIALSPIESWFAWGLILACAVAGAVMYVAGGARRYRRMVEQAESWSTYSDTGTEPVEPLVRVLPVVYDHELHGDFDR